MYLFNGQWKDKENIGIQIIYFNILLLCSSFIQNIHVNIIKNSIDKAKNNYYYSSESFLFLYTIHNTQYSIRIKKVLIFIFEMHLL